MGSCFSRKTVSSSFNNAASSSSFSSASARTPRKSIARAEEQKKSVIDREHKVNKEVLSGAGKEEDDSSTKKEIFVIKHRNSHDSTNNNNGRERQRSSSAEGSGSDNGVGIENGKVDGFIPLSTPVRTSSCSKEEVDAILIQCGRLSRSNSFGNAGKSAVGSSATRKYSGSKRSYDFDEQNDRDLRLEEDGGDASGRGSRRQNRQHHRQSSRNSSPASQARRRTPSRERDQRSGSRERGASGSGSGRRVSRSPGRRSENTTSSAAAAAKNSNSNANDNNSGNGNGNRPPGKMVSVPPTVVSPIPSSNKANCNSNKDGVDAPQTANSSGGIKRISVKRNVGKVVAGSRSVASPRSKSPARGKSDCIQQQPSLSRNSSRKAEQSPHRRNPLAEIDPTSLAYPQASSKWAQTETGREPIQIQIQKQHPLQQTPAERLPRSRSARGSRDLDINPEALLLNPQQTSYTSLLLEDIHNFHTKSNNSNVTSSSDDINNIPPPSLSFQLPACVTKACSILEAVADLNSTTSSNFSSTLSEGRLQQPQQQLSKAKDPFVVESEVVTIDDIMEPSFHKYVTVRRGGRGLSCGREEEMEMQEESSGSNSIVAGGWGNSCSSGWEPSSADSTDRWSSRDNSVKKDGEVEENVVVAPLGLGIGQRVHGLCENRSSRGGRVVMGGIRQGRLAAAAACVNNSRHLLLTTTYAAASTQQ